MLQQPYLSTSARTTNALDGGLGASNWKILGPQQHRQIMIPTRRELNSPGHTLGSKWPYSGLIVVEADCVPNRSDANNDLVNTIVAVSWN